MTGPISRRTVLAGALATGAALQTRTAGAAARAVVEISDSPSEPSVVLVADDVAGQVRVLDHGRVHRLTLGQVEYAYGATKVVVRTSGITSIRRDSDQQFTITYTAPVGKVVGTFTCGLRKVRVRWDVTEVAGLRVDGFRIARTPVGTVTADDYDPVALWNRDRDPDTGAERGGIPFETAHGACYSTSWADNRVFLRVPQSTPGFSNNGFVHGVGTLDSSSAGFLESVVVLSLMRPRSAGVIARDGVLGIDLWTAQPFNLWTTGGTKSVEVQVVNGGLTARTVRVDWRIRDFDGNLTTGTLNGTVGAREIWNATFTATLGGRDIRFVEASVYDVATPSTEAAFARTTLAVLSTYSYLDGEDSRFGMANFAYLPRPSETDVLALMSRLGMKWVRTAYNAYNGLAASPGPTPDALEGASIRHNLQLGYNPALKRDDGTPVQGPPWGGSGTEKQRWAADLVGRCLDAGAKYYECANELNLTAPDKTPKQYVDDLLTPLRDEMADRNATFKVMTCGLAGYPETWVAGFGAAGGWGKVDALAYHPGRGNYVADYVPPEPWTNETRWNFLGTLLKAEAQLPVGKELWLTEAYAPTMPNRWWTDTYRHAAENVLLQLALAKAHGVRCVDWYTLNDSIQSQPMEANPADQEYHYGLLNRDLGPKPSLLAFATAARWLDDATWAGRAELDDPDLFGLVFDGPGGRVNILWSRKNGYLLNDDPGRRIAANPDYYRSPEPWQDMWPTKTAVSLPTPAATSTVRELDCLGREVAVHQASGSRVTVALDGAPRIFIGLSLPLQS